MKKLVFTIAVIALSVVGLSSCGSNTQNVEEVITTDSTTVVVDSTKVAIDTAKTTTAVIK